LTVRKGGTLPFLPLFDDVPGAFSPPMPHSSRFAARDNLTFRVIGGKSGMIAARNGNDVARWAAKAARLGRVLAGSMPRV
jgi:hypothetical protein